MIWQFMQIVSNELETICMNYQIMFSWKKYLHMSPANIIFQHAKR